MKRTWKVVAVLAVALALAATGPMRAAEAGSSQPHVFSPQLRPYGHSYSEWEVRLDQWQFAIPASENPGLVHTGAHCAEGQSGPVWYLIAPMYATDTQTCTVPAGKAFLISPAGWECSTAEGGGDTSAALRDCARKDQDTVTIANVTIDGVHLTNLLTRYRFVTPLFTFKYPADNMLQQVPGPGTTASVGDGIVVMLAPLAAGHHTLEMGSRSVAPHSMAGGVTYHLTVSR